MRMIFKATMHFTATNYQNLSMKLGARVRHICLCFGTQCSLVCELRRDLPLMKEQCPTNDA